MKIGVFLANYGGGIEYQLGNDSDDNIYVGFDESEVRKNYKLDNKLKLFQDEDVLDTWFSSALWTFATLGWPKTKEIDLFHPTNVLVTGFDIIFFCLQE